MSYGFDSGQFDCVECGEPSGCHRDLGEGRYMCEQCSIAYDHESGEDCGVEGCQTCCEHAQCEDGFCLLCGAERMQELINHNAMLCDAAADRRMDKEMEK